MTGCVPGMRTCLLGLSRPGVWFWGSRVPPLGVASGHFCAFLGQDHRSLARLIFGIVRTRLQGLDPGVIACDGHLDTLSSDEEVDWELFEE